MGGGIGGWSGAADDASTAVLVAAADAGVTFFDSAQVYGHGTTDRPLVPEKQTMAQLALRFILSDPAVTTVIPGMRTPGHLAANVAVIDAGPLPAELLQALRPHRWDRAPSRGSGS